jgi:hypothetical protein
MTIAAQLMASGADQQLIASKLQESHAIGSNPSVAGPVSQSNTSTSSEDGFAIDHSENASSLSNTVDVTPAVALQTVPENTQLAGAYALEPDASDQENATPRDVAEPALGGVAPVASTPLAVTNTAVNPVEPTPVTNDTEGHSYLSDAPSYSAPINGTTQPDEAANVDIFSAGDSQATTAPSSTPDAIVPPAEPSGGETESRDEASRDEALAAAHASYDGTTEQPFSPAPGITLPMPPPVPDFGALPQATIAPAYAVDPIAQPPERLGDILAPEASSLALPPQPQPQSSDPGQFQIPGQ